MFIINFCLYVGLQVLNEALSGKFEYMKVRIDFSIRFLKLKNKN